jgi:hypothetical protein
MLPLFRMLTDNRIPTASPVGFPSV